MLYFTLSSLLAAATLSVALPSNPLPQTLTEKDIVVFGSNGRVEVMKRDEYRLLTRDLYSSTPDSLVSFNTTTSEFSAKKLNKRCKSEQIFTMDPDQTFLNWDVAMSSVVKGTGDSTSVSVTEGYSLANSVSVSETLTATVEGFLGASFGISYTETWTTSYAAAYTFTVPNGKYGVIVSNPTTTRKTGHIDIGCIAQATETEKYQADSYTSKSYGGLGWVEGTISLCVGDDYPLKMCTGQGTLS